MSAMQNAKDELGKLAFRQARKRFKNDVECWRISGTGIETLEQINLRIQWLKLRKKEAPYAHKVGSISLAHAKRFVIIRSEKK